MQLNTDKLTSGERESLLERLRAYTEGARQQEEGENIADVFARVRRAIEDGRPGVDLGLINLDWAELRVLARIATGARDDAAGERPAEAEVWAELASQAAQGARLRDRDADAADLLAAGIDPEEPGLAAWTPEIDPETGEPPTDEKEQE